MKSASASSEGSVSASYAHSDYFHSLCFEDLESFGRVLKDFVEAKKKGWIPIGCLGDCRLAVKFCLSKIVD